MQDLIVNVNSGPITMGSIEIASLTGKRHGDVIRDIRAMFDQLGDDAEMRHVIEERDSRGYTSEYHLDRFNSELLVTGYDVKRRSAIIKRWLELEQSSQPKVPTTLSSALRLAADQAEQIEQQQLLIEQSKPAVEFVERYVSADSGSRGFRQVCKLLKAKQPEFRAFLVSKKIMYRLGSEWTAYQGHIDVGRFETKTDVADNGHAFSEAKFTAKGVNWICGLWAIHNIQEAA
jgi:phage antirepressor YoqD-like protein